MSEKEIKVGVKEEAPKENKIKIVRNCATCKNWSGGQLLEPYGRFSYGCKFSGHLTEKQISELGTKDADGNYNCRARAFLVLGFPIRLTLLFSVLG